MKAKEHADVVRAARNGNRAQVARVLVEGNYFTYAAMSERTGRTVIQCKHRYQHLKRKGEWPITWEQLA